MDELLNQLSALARGVWKHRWPGVLVAWVVGAIGAAVVLWVPDKYEASARIYVDTQSILKPLMSGLAVQPNVEQQVAMLSRTLISRPNVEKLIRMADLDLGEKSKDAQEALIERVTKALQIKNTGRDNLYTLGFRDPNPDKAKRVVQSLVSIFVESSLGDTRKDSDVAKKFIDEQIKTYVTKLEEAEARLKEFKLRNLELQTADGKDMSGRLAEISNQLNQARLELREAENARDAAKKQLDAEKTQNTSITSRSHFRNQPRLYRPRRLIQELMPKSATWMHCCSASRMRTPTLSAAESSSRISKSKSVKRWPSFERLRWLFQQRLRVPSAWRRKSSAGCCQLLKFRWLPCAPGWVNTNPVSPGRGSR